MHSSNERGGATGSPLPSSFGGMAYTLTPDGRSLIVHNWDTNTDWLVDVETRGVAKWDVETGDGVAFQRIAP